MIKNSNHVEYNSLKSFNLILDIFHEFRYFSYDKIKLNIGKF